MDALPFTAPMGRRLGKQSRIIKKMAVQNNNQQLGKTLWGIADQLRGSMNADDFRDYMLSFLFLRYLSDNYETAAKKNWAATTRLMP
jgi:hypothetical protein